MNTFRRQLLLKLFILCDVAIVATSLSIAAYAPHAQHHLALLGFLALRVHVHSVLAAIAFLYLTHLGFSAIGLYQSKRLSSPFEELQDILMAATLAAGLAAIAGFVLRTEMITTSVVLGFWTICAGTLMLSRVALRTTLRLVRSNGRNLRHVVIAGTNARALDFAAAIENKADLGYRIATFVDEKWVGPAGAHGTNSPLCGFREFPTFLKTHVVDEVVIALPMKSLYSQASAIVEVCREQGVIVRVLSDLFNASGQHAVSQFERRAVVTLYTFPFEGWSLIAKRALDIVVSGALLVILTPLFLLVVALIRLDSRGPVIFVQDRIGLNKRRFRMCKFRSMAADAERLQAGLEKANEASGPVFKIKNDPRITRIGRILRKTSIDELPQLLNVLTGDMSLVGPRPLPVRDYDKGFDQNWQRRRFSIRPGITCLWQINGRSSTSFDDWMDLDMQYIDRWSLWLDLKILARTVPAVVKGSGAA